MKAEQIASLINGKSHLCAGHNAIEFGYAFASDLMSDVLRTDSENLLLITGLCNLQTVRTAEVSDIKCIVIGRGKTSCNEMKQLAHEADVSIIESPFSVFRICSILGSNGIQAIY